MKDKYLYIIMPIFTTISTYVLLAIIEPTLGDATLNQKLGLYITIGAYGLIGSYYLNKRKLK